MVELRNLIPTYRYTTPLRISLQQLSSVPQVAIVKMFDCITSEVASNS